MSYKVNENDCTNCGICEGSCPSEAIIEKGNFRWIDPDKCVACGACESDCPATAISAG